MLDFKLKYQNLFVFLFAVLAFFSILGFFIGKTFESIIFFFTVLLLVVFLILNKRFEAKLTDYRKSFIYFDIVCIFSVLSVCSYCYGYNLSVLNCFLVELEIFYIVLVFVDLFIMNNRYLTTDASNIISMTNLCSSICILTYFFGVTFFWFAAVASMIGIFNIFFRVLIIINSEIKIIDDNKKPNSNNTLDFDNVEKLIKSTDIEGGVE